MGALERPPCDILTESRHRIRLELNEHAET